MMIDDAMTTTTDVQKEKTDWRTAIGGKPLYGEALFRWLALQVVELALAKAVVGTHVFSWRCAYCECDGNVRWGGKASSIFIVDCDCSGMASKSELKRTVVATALLLWGSSVLHFEDCWFDLKDD